MNTRLAKVTSGTSLSRTHNINARAQVGPEVVSDNATIRISLAFDVGLQLRKELFNRIQCGRVGRQIEKLDTRLGAQLLYPIRVMYRCVVHH